MELIEGKIKKVIFNNATNGYLVALFKVSKGSLEKKTITIVGMIPDVKLDVLVSLNVSATESLKYGQQFLVKSYEYLNPTKEEDIKSFLKSSFVKSCGEKTANLIVDTLGSDALNIIKKNKFVLDKIKGITEKRRDNIYESLINYSMTGDIILKLKEVGFTTEEAGLIYSSHKNNVLDILNNNIYLFNDVIDFSRIDSIFLNNNSNDYNDSKRVKACILNGCMNISYSVGDVYYLKQDLLKILKKYLININLEELENYLIILDSEQLLVVEDDKIYLKSSYDSEVSISNNLFKINKKKIKEKDYLKDIIELETKENISYNESQKEAIIKSLNNNITIISGGPGTGKTTIIKAITKLYIKENNIYPSNVCLDIALIAPTGRASKKMHQSTGIEASTIHRFLKWNKETNEFSVNENNKNIQKLVIIDEASMMDTFLFASLLKGLHSYVKLIIVGDINQLPSVGPGLVLKDLIDSDLFNYIPLNKIYRQSEESYIPYFADEIKNKDLSENFLIKKDDYNFIRCDSKDIVNNLDFIVSRAIKKGYKEDNIQILSPIYKTELGIDNLNIILKNIFNKSSQNELVSGDITYNEGDKVIQLVNDFDNNVFNGDIGYIKTIGIDKDKKEFMTIEFDESTVTYKRKDLKNIKHAYAITVHKSQGSEFDLVIMPITNRYGNMLYNKLLYTAVSRAKKSLILIGNIDAFINGISNDYSEFRKTSLKDKLKKEYINT